MADLRKFAPSEIVLSHLEAWQVLVFFFGGNAGTKPGWLNDDDRSFAQALLIEAIDASYKIGWIETLWRSSSNPSASVKSIIKALVKKAAKDWFKNATKSKLEDPQIYEMVKNTIALKWKSGWNYRVQTDGADSMY